MFSVFKEKPQEEIAVVFEIGSGSIGAALVHFKKEGIPTILYTHREPLTFIDHVTSHRLLGAMLQLLHSVAAHVSKEGLSHLHRTWFAQPMIKHVYCIFTSPWYVSQTKVTTISKEKQFLVTQNSINDILTVEQERLSKDMAEGKYEKQFGTNLKLMEQNIIHTRLNGYEVKDPTGKRAHELEVAFFISFISKDVLGRVEHVLRKAFHFDKLECFSSALSATTALRTIFPDNDQFLIADVSGEVTDISLISKGALMETNSFPLGRSFLVRSVVDELIVTPPVALSYLRLYYENKASALFAEKIAAILQSAGNIWQTQFNTALAAMAKNYSLPKYVFIITDQDLSRFFVTQLERQADSDNGVSHALEALLIDSDRMRPFIDVGQKVASDPVLALHSIFLQTIVL